MPRYKLRIEYNGMHFHGWQRQESVISVQEALEDAIFSLTQQRTLVEGAGRTDRGVHATGQVAHADLEKDWDPFRLKAGLNHFLSYVSVVNIEKTDNDFHARFSAKQRRYCYHIISRSSPLALDHERAWHVKRNLNRDAMSKACTYLVGFHDFSAFRSVSCQAKNPHRTMLYAGIEANGERLLLHFHAPSFLHNQVRIMTGALKMIGEGKYTPEEILKAFETKQRIGPTAPPYGLYLTDVLY